MSSAVGSSVDLGSKDVHLVSETEMSETARRVREEDPRWRLVFPVTHATRKFIFDQMPALFITYGLAMALIFVVVVVESTRPLPMIGIWVFEGGASIAARVLILRRMARASSVQVASSARLRLLPVFGICLAAIHWGWTAALFIGPQLDLTTVVLLLTYVMLSLACLGLAPASPVICAAYLLPMWSAVAWMLVVSEWATGAALLALSAALGGVFWSWYYIIVSRVRRSLVDGDEKDLLMRELRERNREVELLRATAAADLETRATVFASASHDLRQRIHALKLLAHSSATHSSNKSPLRRMASTIEELESFVTDVLQFVRFDSGSKTNRFTAVPLQQVLQSMELQFEALALQKGARLRTRATPLWIKTDAVMLGRVLENLVSNALKFTRKDVLVVARKRRDGVYLEVWDVGLGLDPKRLEGSTTTTSSKKNDCTAAPVPTQGFGLGLMIVRRLVEALGYRIEVRSKAQRGTLIRIVIPTHYLLPESQP
jgi:signal transduction histidine kinase